MGVGSPGAVRRFVYCWQCLVSAKRDMPPNRQVDNCFYVVSGKFPEGYAVVPVDRGDGGASAGEGRLLQRRVEVNVLCLVRFRLAPSCVSAGGAGGYPL